MQFGRPMLLLVLLLVVAAVQYHWVGKVSRAERVRLNNLLAESRVAFAEDMDDMLTRLSIQLLIPGTQGTDITQNLPDNLAEWQSRSPWPNLVKNTYLMRFPPSRPQVKRLNQADAEFQEIALPDHLISFSQHIQENLLGRRNTDNRNTDRDIEAPPGERRQRHRRGGPRRRVSLSVVHTDPLLLHFLVQGERTAPGFLVIELDRDVLDQTIFPTLIRRHFSEDFLITVRTANNKGKIIYTSADKEVPLTGQETTRFFGLRLSPRLSDIRNLPEEFRKNNFVSEHFRRRDPTIMRALGPALMENRDGKAGAMLVVAQHRSGSLDTVLERARINNMIISTGILGILGISMFLMIRSAERGKQLARRQLEFVAGISHELMTPLAGIRSAAQNLAEGVITEGPKVRRYGQVIEGESQRLTTMVEKVLDYAGIQAGRRQYTLVPIPAGVLLRSCLADCKALLESAGFTLEQQIPEDLPTIAADRSAFARIVQNLVGNAIKYTADAAYLKVHAETAGNRLLLHFADKGPGIPKEDLATIFEPFYRGKQHVASNVAGSGLGLCLVQHIVKGHNGRITVDSSPAGTTFHIDLPIHSATV